MFQFPGYRAPVLRQKRRRMTGGGLPHSEISGSKPVCGSPELIAAYHVLHRLLMPSHPPLAVTGLITKKTYLVKRNSIPRLLHAEWGGVTSPNCQRANGRKGRTTSSVFHGDGRDRTGDLLLAKQALSQLSYVPSPTAASAAKSQESALGVRPLGSGAAISGPSGRLRSGVSRIVGSKKVRINRHAAPCAEPGPRWIRTTDPRVISTVL